jgi:hypothetical protein
MCRHIKLVLNIFNSFCVFAQNHSIAFRPSKSTSSPVHVSKTTEGAQLIHSIVLLLDSVAVFSYLHRIKKVTKIKSLINLVHLFHFRKVNNLNSLGYTTLFIVICSKHTHHLKNVSVSFISLSSMSHYVVNHNIFQFQDT